MFDQKCSRYSWRHYKSMIINFEDNSKYLWWQWSLDLWSKIYNVSLDQYTNKSFIWCVKKKMNFNLKYLIYQDFVHVHSYWDQCTKYFITFYFIYMCINISSPLQCDEKKISKQGWRSDLIIYPMLLIIPTLQAIWWNSRLTRWYDHVWDFHTPGYWFL